MYGDVLAPKSPMGAPPPVATPPLPVGAPGPPPALGAALGPAAPPPPGATSLPGQVPPPNPMAEQMARMQYEAQQNAFAKQLAADFVQGKISREDLKKGAAYTGTDPYHQWKQDNVLHLKEAAKG